MLTRVRQFMAGKTPSDALLEHIDLKAASPDGLAALAVVRPIEFAWLWLRDSDAERIRVGVELASSHGAFIESLFPPVIACWFGAFPHLSSSEGARVQFIAEAQQAFGEHAKARHGVLDACVKNVGSPTRFAMVVSCDSRGDILSGLSAQPFGTFQLHAPKG